MDLEETILSTEGTGCYYAVFQEEDQLRILVEMIEKNTKKVEVAMKEKIFREYGVDSFIEKVDKSSFYKVMDSMLKPGRASITEVRKIIRG
jgi:DNA polymerase II large subunit